MEDHKGRLNFTAPLPLRAFALNFVILLLCVAALACSWAGQGASPSAGTAQGLLTRQLDTVEKGLARASLQPVGDPVVLNAGEAVRVSNGGEALLDYGEGLSLRLFNDTSSNLVEATNLPGAPLNVQLALERGGMTGRLTSPGGSFQVRTPGGAQILVLGTRFFIIFDPATLITWVGNFEGLLGVAAGGQTVQLDAGYYLMVPAGQRPGPPLPLPFTQEQLEQLARQLTSASAALARLALRGIPPTQVVSNQTQVPRETVPVITLPPVETVPPATQAPAPASPTPQPDQEPTRLPPTNTVPAATRLADTVPPYIEVLDPSTEPVGVGLTCPPGSGIVRLKAVVFDPSGVASVSASWSLGSLRGVEQLRHNEKGNYIGEIGPLDTPGTMRVMLTAVDVAGNRGSIPPFSVQLSACEDYNPPVIGALEISPQLVPGLVCAGTPAPLVLSVRINDDGQIDRVMAVWEAGGDVRSATMEPVGEGRYQANLLLESAAGQVPLQVEAYDTAGNKSVSSTLPLLVEQCADRPPVIEALELSASQIAAGKDCPVLPGTVTVTARVVDDRGLGRVTARWSLGEASSDTQLEQVEPDLYQVELGPFEAHGILNIEVGASDSAGQNADPRRDEVAVTGCPDSAGPEIEILSVEPREVFIQSDCTPQIVTVTARVNDGSPLRQVLVTWQQGEVGGEAPLKEVDQGVYQAELGPFPSTGEVSLVISAWDEPGNESRQEVGNVVVSACEVSEQ